MINVNEIYNHNKNNCSPKKGKKKKKKKASTPQQDRIPTKEIMNRIEKRAIAITSKLGITSHFTHASHSVCIPRSTNLSIRSSASADIPSNTSFLVTFSHNFK